jgi:3-deoxy-7-phosphoheptulonate synthase
LDLLSWACIGARSSEDQEHRIFASAVDCAVGVKNPTHGSLEVAINSILAVQHGHPTILDGYEIVTKGNSYAHIVLRGANKQQNCSLTHLKEIDYYFQLHKINNPAVLIDASHDNCVINGKKDCALQASIVNQVMDDIDHHPHLKKLVKGFMIESFIQEGNQDIKQKNRDNIDLNGLSITDPCLSWEKTEEFLLEIAERRKTITDVEQIKKCVNY